MLFILKDTPAKDSAILRAKDFVLTIQAMQSNEYTIPQSKNSGRNVKYLSAPHQVSLDSVETGAVYGIPRNNCFLLPCVLKIFKQSLA